MAKKQSLSQIETSLARWKTRLRRAVTMIDKLEKQQKRMQKAAVRVSVPAHPTVDSETTLGAVPPKPEPLAVQIMREMAAPAPAPVKVDDDIPAFLRRQKTHTVHVLPDGEETFVAPAQQIREEQAAKKLAKSRGRIATMKAKKSGETRKMPLTGKAALAAIRG